MAPAKADNLHKYLLGIAITLSLLLGGGTDTGLWSDAVLQIAILLAVTPVLLSRHGTPIDRRALWFATALICAPLLQLVPLPATLVEGLRPVQYHQPEGSEASWLLLTTSVGSTLFSFAYVGVLSLLFIAILRLPGLQVHALLPFLLLGIACNSALVLVQFSASSNQSIEGVMPFTMYAGLFANRNHLSSAFYVVLPFLVYFATFRDRAWWAWATILVTLLILLAAGSRAGAIIGAAAVICSLVFIRVQSRSGVAGVLAGMVVLGIYAMGTWTIVERKEIDADFGRLEFLRTTIEGIKDNWIAGVGYGTFPRAYQAYEDARMIFRSFVNHAHNDYAEVVFEGGLVAALLIAVYLILLARQLPLIRFNQFQKAAMLSIVFLLVHSVVDYPLRTMALAVAFVWLNAVVFHADFRRPEQRRRHRVAVRHGGRTIAVPVEGG